MSFISSQNVLPINQEIKGFKSNKPQKSDLSFYGQTSENEPAKVNSDLAKSYLGIENSKNKDEKPFTYEELSYIKLPDGGPRFSTEDKIELVEISKEYPKSVRKLVEYKDSSEHPRFSEFEIKLLAPLYEKHPKEVDELAKFTTSDNISRLPGFSIQFLLDTYLKYPDSVKELLKFEENGEPRFSSTEIENLAEIYENSSEDIKALAGYKKDDGDIQFSGREIVYAVKLCKNNKIRKFIFENADNIKSIKSLSSDDFIEMNLGDKTIHFQSDSENHYKIIGEENVTTTDKKTTSELRTPDGSVRLEEYKNTGSRDFREFTETLYGKDGNIISRTSLRPSSMAYGGLLIFKELYDEDENLIDVKNVGTYRVSGKNSDHKRIEKNYVSPSGVESWQLIKSNPKESSAEFKVGDTKFVRSTKKTGENTAETLAWGNKYEAKYNNDNIEVTVTKKDGTIDSTILDYKNVNPAIKPLLRKLPGDCLYTAGKNGTKISMADALIWEGNAYFDYGKNEIALSLEKVNDPFTFAHEYGHFLDDIVLKDLHDDEKLQEVFKKELDAYKSQATGMSEKQIMYFISKTHKNKGGCLTEVIAESTAIILGLPHNNDELLLREKLLQENFPETIAYIGSKIEKAMA